jgi:adenylate cyclase, class 2
MPTEYEAKVLDIAEADIRGLIASLGGEQTGPTKLMRRYVYDIEPGDMSRWVRLRDIGDEVTLTVKEIKDDGIAGTEETEVTVSDFDVTNALLGKIGYFAKSYQENRRTSFVLDGAALEIDEWPLIPAYLEIEGDGLDHVLRVARRLGFEEHQLTGENTIKVYARYGIDLPSITDLRFATEPATA